MSGRAEASYKFSEIGPLQFWRHVIQLITFVFLNGKLFGLASTALIVPYLWSTEAPYSTVHGAYESLEYTIARGVFPLLVLGVIYLTAVTVGRVFCGWACPMGMIQDFLSYLPFKKEPFSQSTISQLRDIKWVIVGFSVLTTTLVGFRRATTELKDPVGVFSDSPFSVLSPAGTLFTYIPYMFLWNPNVLATAGMVAWIKFGILVSVLVPSLYVPRFFCRYICPMGALLEPLSAYKFLRIQKSPKAPKEAIDAILRDVCPTGVQADDSEFIDSPACIHCGKCITESQQMLWQKLG